MSQEDFVSFEKALRDLQMRSEELRKLVSEGEIRAFRDGSSMKFKREDIDALQMDDLDDALEDDTGMVTEELSDEDTLLVSDDDDVIEAAPAAAPAAGITASTSRSSRVRATDEKVGEPGWVTAVAILGAVFMVYGFMVCYSLATGAPPNGFTTLLAM